MAECFDYGRIKSSLDEKCATVIARLKERRGKLSQDLGTIFEGLSKDTYYFNKKELSSISNSYNSIYKFHASLNNILERINTEVISGFDKAARKFLDESNKKESADSEGREETDTMLYNAIEEYSKATSFLDELRISQNINECLVKNIFIDKVKNPLKEIIDRAKVVSEEYKLCKNEEERKVLEQDFTKFSFEKSKIANKEIINHKAYMHHLKNVNGLISEVLENFNANIASDLLKSLNDYKLYCNEEDNKDVNELIDLCEKRIDAEKPVVLANYLIKKSTEYMELNKYITKVTSAIKELNDCVSNCSENCDFDLSKGLDDLLMSQLKDQREFVESKLRYYDESLNKRAALSTNINNLIRSLNSIYNDFNKFMNGRAITRSLTSLLLKEYKTDISSLNNYITDITKYKDNEQVISAASYIKDTSLSSVFESIKGSGFREKKIADELTKLNDLVNNIADIYNELKSRCQIDSLSYRLLVINKNIKNLKGLSDPSLRELRDYDSLMTSTISEHLANA